VDEDSPCVKLKTYQIHAPNIEDSGILIHSATLKLHTGFNGITFDGYKICDVTGYVSLYFGRNC
jgi:hypothetical protein